uniref:Uncharacterized protein n=1 Tax=Anguilla anguilla TaxID=7936 RepID=A0A0E9RF27_ANGAN
MGGERGEQDYAKISHSVRLTSVLRRSVSHLRNRFNLVQDTRPGDNVSANRPAAQKWQL